MPSSSDKEVYLHHLEDKLYQNLKKYSADLVDDHFLQEVAEFGIALRYVTLQRKRFQSNYVGMTLVSIACCIFSILSSASILSLFTNSFLLAILFGIGIILFTDKRIHISNINIWNHLIFINILAPVYITASILQQTGLTIASVIAVALYVAAILVPTTFSSLSLVSGFFTILDKNKFGRILKDLEAP
jgi:hypothetical protein